jgi:hypothetical protein
MLKPKKADVLGSVLRRRFRMGYLARQLWEESVDSCAEHRLCSRCESFAPCSEWLIRMQQRAETGLITYDEYVSAKRVFQAIKNGRGLTLILVLLPCLQFRELFRV